MNELEVIALASEYACLSNRRNELLASQETPHALFADPTNDALEDYDRCTDRLREMYRCVDDLDDQARAAFRTRYWEKTCRLEGRT
jgi:hypothetical protein